MRRPVFPCFALFVVILLVLSGALDVAEGAEMDFARWKILSQERTADAGMTIAFELVLPQGVSPDNADVVYVSIPKRGAEWGLARALADELMTDVRVLKLPQFTVAYGAAESLAN
jgi:hypothetical protein